MRRALPTCLLLGSFLLATAASAADILTLDHREATLPNGLRVFMIKYPSPGVVSYQVAVHAGSRNEIEAGKTGFAHFFEHLMFRGTKKRSAKEFGDLYVRLGAENNAFTDHDMTDYQGVVATVYLPQILDAEADRFAHLDFSEKLLRDEAGAVLGEYNKDVAQPDFQLDEKVSATAFKVHPYAHSVMGYKEDILKFTERYKDVWPFFRRYYRPDNVRVILVGDLDFDATLKVVQAKFGPWKAPAETPVTIPAEPAQTEARVAEVKLAKPTQTRIVVGYKVPAFSTKTLDSSELALLSEMLFSVTSDFQKEYRYDKKWLDSVSAPPAENVDPGLWEIELRLTDAGEGKDQELLAAIDRVIAGARDKPPSKERLSATQSRLRNDALSSWFASPEALAGRVAWYTNFEPDLGVLSRVVGRVAEVTPENVRDFARANLVDAHKTTVVLRGAPAQPSPRKEGK